MTGSSVSGTPETIVGPLRDEATLESLFRAHFAALSAEAKSHLGAEAASSSLGSSVPHCRTTRPSSE